MNLRAEIMELKEEIMNVRNELKQEMIKQYRFFLTFNLAIFTIITTILIYLVSK